MEYLITNIDSLEKLKSDKNIKNSIRKIKLNLLDNNATQLYERKINKYYFACGCQEGAFLVYLTLFGSLLICWVSGINILTNWWKIVIVLAISALTGKLSGLLLSRYKLKKIFRTLEIYFSNHVVS